MLKSRICRQLEVRIEANMLTASTQQVVTVLSEASVFRGARHCDYQAAPEPAFTLAIPIASSNQR